MYARCPADGYPMGSQQLTRVCFTKDFALWKFELHQTKFVGSNLIIMCLITSKVCTHRVSAVGLYANCYMVIYFIFIQMCLLYFNVSLSLGETGRACHMKTSPVLTIVCKCVTAMFLWKNYQK